ncbi:protein kinase [Chloroflexota bacterium]
MDDFTERIVRGYKLLECIGQGGFGAVYKAEHPEISRQVAIKIIHPQYANNPEYIRRFELEAQIVARLEHLHIVPLYDYWRDPDGAYLVMRYLRGGTLEDLIVDGIELRLVAQLLDHIAAALAVAHRHSVVHRDIKPRNILLDEDQNAYLTDFGIAKDLESLSAQLTQGDGLVGTYAYASPEQLETGVITPQSDLYSLGIVLYQMLTSEYPFSDVPISRLALAHLTEPLPMLHKFRTDLPAALDAIIQRATAKAAEDRYPDALALARAFRQALSPEQARDSQDTYSGQIEAALLPDEMTVTPVSKVVPQQLENPYKGLRPFQQADALDFFGRDALVGRLLDRLVGDTEISRLIAVIGPSGSGKSSVVKAGLLPKLRSGDLPGAEDWFVVETTPRANPFEELEINLLRIAHRAVELSSHLHRDERGLLRAARLVLPDDDSELLLVVDQFEELFTAVDDEALRARFLDVLYTAATDPHSPIRIIITLRADFLDRPLQYPDFAGLLSRCTELVLPLTPDELEQVIVSPARQVGVTVEPRLVEAIVADVGHQPGTLPLLQYALTELFECSENLSLSVDAYRATGGVLGALTRRADELYLQQDAAGQETIRQVFLQLVNPGEGTEDMRRRVPLRELASLGEHEEETQAIIESFGKYRLLTFDCEIHTRIPLVEIAHDALIRDWERLKNWLVESRDELKLHRQLASFARDWQDAQKDASFLLRGTRLDQFEDWLRHTDITINRREVDYVADSLADREARQAEEAARRQREEQIARRAQTFGRMAALLGIIGVFAIIATVLAVVQSNDALQMLDVAAMTLTPVPQTLTPAQITLAAGSTQIVVAQETIVAGETAVADLAELHSNISRSLRLASEAQAALYNSDTLLALPLALAANIAQNPPAMARRVLAEVSFAPGISRIFTGHSDEIVGVSFSPDGKRILSGDRNGCQFTWDVDSGQPIITIGENCDVNAPDGSIQPNNITFVAYSPDGNVALAGTGDGDIIAWAMETGQEMLQLRQHQSRISSIAFSSDGLFALSASFDGTLILWDLDSGESIRVFTGHNVPVTSVAYSPTAMHALSGDMDGVLIMWDVETGDEIGRLDGHQSRINDIVFSSDGREIITASDDTTLLLWDAETGESLHQFMGHTDWVTDVDFSPDGRLVVSGSTDHTIRLWDVESRTALFRLQEHMVGVTAVAFSRDGNWIVTGLEDHQLYLWDIRNTGQVMPLADAVTIVRFRPGSSGHHILAATVNQELILWDAQNEVIVDSLDVEGNIRSAAFTPDGESVLAYDDRGVMILWDLDRKQWDNFAVISSWVNAIDFHPDGDEMLLGTEVGTIQVWDLTERELLFETTALDSAVKSMVINPDGDTVLAGYFDGRVVLWNLSSGAVVREFAGHESSVAVVAISPDGTHAISGSWDKTLILWDLETGLQVRSLVGHTGRVTSGVFSRDGRVFVSGSSDKTIRLWDIDSGAEIGRFTGHTEEITSLSVSTDGTSIVSGSWDHSVRAWPFVYDLDDIIQWIHENRYVRELSCEERITYEVLPLCEDGGAS